MENVAYNYTLNYGTCESFGSVYSFYINVYHRLYFSSTTNKRPNKKDGEPITPFKLAIGTTPSVSHLRVFIFLCVVQKATEDIGKRR